MTHLTALILEAAKGIELSPELAGYFDQWTKDGEIVLTDVKRLPRGQWSSGGLLEIDINRLYEHCEVMATIGMVRQQPEAVERMVREAFELLNGQRVIGSGWNDAKICVCTSTEHFAYAAHVLGFEETYKRIWNSASCPVAGLWIRKWWESYRDTPEDHRDTFVQYARVRAGNILERLLAKA